MQQIDRAILEVAHRLIESGLDEARKTAIERIMVALELTQYLRAVVAVMWIALPRINRVAARAGAQFLHGLTEGAERHAREGTQLHEHSGPQHVHKKHPKRNVLRPEARACCGSYSQRVGETNWVIERVEKSDSFKQQALPSGMYATLQRWQCRLRHELIVH